MPAGEAPITTKKLRKRAIEQFVAWLAEHPEFDRHVPINEKARDQLFDQRDKIAGVLVNPLELPALNALLDDTDWLWEWREDHDDTILEVVLRNLRYWLTAELGNWFDQRNPPPGGVEIGPSARLQQLLDSLLERGLDPDQVVDTVIPQLSDQKIRALALEIMTDFPDDPHPMALSPERAGDVPRLMLVNFLERRLFEAKKARHDAG